MHYLPSGQSVFIIISPTMTFHHPHPLTYRLQVPGHHANRTIIVPMFSHLITPPNQVYPAAPVYPMAHSFPFQRFNVGPIQFNTPTIFPSVNGMQKPRRRIPWKKTADLPSYGSLHDAKQAAFSKFTDPSDSQLRWKWIRGNSDEVVYCCQSHVCCKFMIRVAKVHDKFIVKTNDQPHSHEYASYNDKGKYSVVLRDIIHINHRFIAII